jgi:hypothetical protein
VITSQAEIDRINSKIRLRILQLPVRHGKKWGELKRCQLRKGGVYTLQARVPYDTYKTQAREQPTRARAVLWLMDRCDISRRTVTITVTDVGRQSDRPVYLARNNDFTMIASQQTVPGDPEYMSPFAKDLERARAKALEARVSPELAAVRERASDVSELQRSMKNMKARSLAKRIERNYRAIERLLLSEGVVDSSVVAAANGSPGEVDRLPSANTLATPEAA